MRTNISFFSLLFTFLLIFIFLSKAHTTTPGDYWLRLTKSQRVNYLVGYIHGIDTVISVDLPYKGTWVEDFLYSSQKLRIAILRRATELYKEKANRVIDWKSMLFLACMELGGETKDIIQERLLTLRRLLKPYFGEKNKKPGDCWLLIPEADRLMYLEGLIEGIRTGIIVKEQQDLKTKALYEGLFNIGEEIWKIADIVTEFYRDPENRIIDYRFLFPVAFLKFTKAEESSIKEMLKELRKTEKSRRQIK